MPTTPSPKPWLQNNQPILGGSGGLLEGWIAKPSQTNAAINSITSNEVLNQIRSVFGNDIPCEILYNYHLAHITNPKVLIGDGYFDQLHKDYLGANNDKYKPKFMQLVVFEILPTFGKYQEAERLITDPKDLEKLRKIQHLHEEQKAQQRLAKQNQEKKGQLPSNRRNSRP